MTDIGDYPQLVNAARIRNGHKQVCVGCARDLNACDCHSKKPSDNSNERQAGSR